MQGGPSTVTVYPMTNYSFGTKPPKPDKDSSLQQRMDRLKDKYLREGLRRTVEGVVIVHEHGHPHVLLLQLGTSFYKLPGGRLRPGEGEIDCLLRKLDTYLGPEAENLKPKWQIGDLLATFYRPNYDNSYFPYCPAHITRPKEMKRLFFVQLPERCYFAVPKNFKLIAVPLFETYDNMPRYGPVIASIPQIISRFSIHLAGGGIGADNDKLAEGQSGDMKIEQSTDDGQQGGGGLRISLGGGAQAQQDAPKQENDNELMVDFDD